MPNSIIVKRSKKNYRTARAAWLDVKRKRNISHKRVKRAKHDSKFWRWEIRK